MWQGGRASRAVCAAAADDGIRTWTNPDGKILKPLAAGVWMAERPFVWNRIDVGGRMAVIQLPDGSLWVHSPVHLEPRLKAQLEALGPVKHIVSPNYEHVKYAKQWIEAYPDAHSYACPGLREKEPKIPFSDTVGVNNNTPDSWPSEIEVTHLNYDVNPFTRSPFFNEVVFSHKPSGTLMVTDLFWNYPEDVPAGTKLWKVGMDRVYRPFYFSFMIKDQDAYKNAMERLFSQEWHTIMPCHGTVVDANAKQVLRDFVGAW